MIYRRHQKLSIELNGREIQSRSKFLTTRFSVKVKKAVSEILSNISYYTLYTWFN